MKKSLLLIGICLLLLPLSLAVLNDADVYYSFDTATVSGTTVNDISGATTHDGTKKGSTEPAQISALLNEGVDFDGTDDYLDISSVVVPNLGNAYSVSFWIYPDVIDSTKVTPLSIDADNKIILEIDTDFTGNALFSVDEGTLDFTLTASAWNHVVLIKTDNGVDGAEVFVAGSSVGTFTAGDHQDLDLFDVIGARFDHAQPFNGKYDEFSIYDRALSGAEVTSLYNSGSGYNPYDVAPSVDENHTITVLNLYNDTVANNISVTVTGEGTYTNTTGNNVYTDFSSTNLYTVTVSANGFFTREYPLINLSLNSTFKLKNSDIKISVKEVLSNDTLTPVNITIGDSTNLNNYYLSAGTHKVRVSKSGYYPINYSLTVSPLQNETISLLGLYSTIINITATNSLTGKRLNNLSGYVYHNQTGINTSFQNVTGNESYFKGIKGDDYYIYLVAGGYAIGSTNYQEVSPSSMLTNISFSLYTKNSIQIRIYDQDTASLITQNLTVVISSDTIEDTYTTANGLLFIDNLTDNTYTVKASNANYSLVSYIITVNENSFQYLNMYLGLNTDTVIFTIKDFDSKQELQGATLVISRLINNSWVTIEAKESDITGRVQVSYKTGLNYRFTVTKTDYETNIFYLNPVLFDNYNVLLSKSTILDDAPAYLSVIVDFNKEFYANESNNLTLLINSPSGSLENYNFSVTTVNDSFFFSGSNATGQSFNQLFNLPESIDQNVTVAYCYDLTIGSTKCLSTVYSVTGVYDPYSFRALQNNEFGLGVFERILLVTLMVIILAGIIGLFAGFLAGGAVGLIIMGFFTFTGFIPLWAVLPSILVGIVLIMGRSD